MSCQQKADPVLFVFFHRDDADIWSSLLAASALPSSFSWRALQPPVRRQLLLRTRACPSQSLVPVSPPPHNYFLLSEDKLLLVLCLSPPPAEPTVPVKTKPPSPPASSSITAALGGDVTPSATSSPREEPNGLEDSVNGAPVKRPHSPTEEEMAKRHKEAEVSCRLLHLDEPGVAGI